MKCDLTGDLILFRPVMKVEYINNCKSIFDFKQMGLFMICLGLWFLEGLSDMIVWDRSYWFSFPKHCFVDFCFLLEFKEAL